MALYRSLLFILIAFVLILASCTKPVLIGSDFLEDEKASLRFEDNFDLAFFTEKTDSVIVHSENISQQLFTYLCGDVHDPIFGHYTAEIYVQPRLPTIATDLIGSIFDSVVLLLRYDTLGSYGSLEEPVTLEVYGMIENPEFEEDYYSNQQFMASSELLGSLTFVPKPKDSVTVIQPGDTSVTAPHVRIPLSVIKMSEILLQDSIVFTNQDSFLNYFNGLYIKMTGAENTMLGFNLLNTVSGLAFYYDRGDLLDREFRFIFTTSSFKTVYMEHDYTGSIVAQSLTPDPETEYWYVQGMSGVTTKMTIGGLPDLGNVIINQAELEVYCSFPDGDVPNLYPPIVNLITQERTDTSMINSIDVNIALARTNGDFSSEGFETIFGGTLKKVTDGPPAIYRYNMKVTAQVKDIYKGTKENIIYFNPIEKANWPNRSVMFGPDHPAFAPRLRIYYTAL